MDKPQVQPTKLPKVVILESTALFQLGSLFESVDFSDLQQWRKLLKFEIAVSQVSWLEFLRLRREQVAECINRVRQLRSSLGKLGQNDVELTPVEERLTDLDKNLVAFFEKKLSASEIQILPLAKPSLELLLQMAIENTPPFEQSGEKGFRDSLIMFSILDAIRNRPELNAIVVSNDALFTQGVLARQAEYATTVKVVSDLKKAVAYIDGSVDVVLRARRAEEKQEAKALLLQYLPEIEKAVNEIRELSYFDVAHTGRTVERVLSLRFNDVDSATWKNRSENSATILFSLKCSLTVLVGPPIWDVLNSRYQIGGGSTLLTPRNTDPKEVQMEKAVYGIATFLGKEGERKLDHLQIDTSLPVEDLAELTATL
jgi:hypothetical protein